MEETACVLVTGSGGGGGHFFSESFWDGVYSIIQILNNGKGLKHTCLERGPCLSGKGLLNYLRLELGVQ